MSSLSTVKRLLAVLLAAVMLAMSLAACGGDGGKDETTAPSADNNPSGDASYLDTALPTDTYNGESFGVIGGEGMKFQPEEAENSEPVHDALFRRNGKIEERYDIDFKYYSTSWGGETNTQLEQSSAAGEQIYDLVYGNFQTVGTYAINNSLILSAENFPTVDLTQKWWSQDCMNQLTIHDKVFFLTGYIAYDYTTDGSSIFFNKKIATDKGMGDHFQLVKDGKWTIDTMNENMKKVANDENGDGVMDSNDKWGLVFGNDFGYGFYYASGVKLIDYDENDEPYFIASSNDVITKIDYLCSILSNRKVVANVSDEEGLVSAGGDMFSAGKTLYTTAQVHTGASDFRTKDFYDFGILPFPMWNEDQGEYMTWAYTWSGGGIFFPITNHDEEMTGVIVEALAYQSSVDGGYYNALLQKYIKGKGTYDQESEDMVDLVLSTKLYDIGMIFGWGVASIANQATTGVWDLDVNGNFSSMYATRVNAAKKAVRTTIRAWDKLD